MPFRTCPIATQTGLVTRVYTLVNVGAGIALIVKSNIGSSQPIRLPTSPAGQVARVVWGLSPQRAVTSRVLKLNAVTVGAVRVSAVAVRGIPCHNRNSQSGKTPSSHHINRTTSSGICPENYRSFFGHRRSASNAPALPHPSDSLTP